METVWKKPSVRKDPAEKIQVRFGQDESAFKAYAMNASAWKVDGRDKNDGPGRMINPHAAVVPTLKKILTSKHG